MYIRGICQTIRKFYEFLDDIMYVHTYVFIYVQVKDNHIGMLSIFQIVSLQENNYFTVCTADSF